MQFGVDVNHKHGATSYVTNIFLGSDSLKEKDNLEYLGVDRKLIGKFIFKEMDWGRGGVNWIYVAQDRN
jgi:hypothetical protein